MSELLKLEDEIRFKDINYLPCRQDKFRVWITPYDVYQIAKSLNISPGEVIRRYAAFDIDPELRIPKLMIQPACAGVVSCPFLLGEYGCALGARRPDACKMSPLNRVYDRENNSAGFRLPDEARDESADPITVGDWINSYSALMDGSLAGDWHHLQDALSKSIAAHGDDIAVNTVLMLWYILFPALYTEYDMEEDFEPQFKRNLRQMIDRIDELKESGEDHAGDK